MNRGVTLTLSVLLSVAAPLPPLPVTIPPSPPAMPAMVEAQVQYRAQVWGEWLEEINGPYREERPTRRVTVESRTVAPPGGNAGMGNDVEQWRSLVDAHFGPLGLTGEALAVMACESGGNPNARNRSGASGLFQFMPGTWGSFGSGDPFDPEANVAAAANLVGYSIGRGDWRWAHWTCQP